MANHGFKNSEVGPDGLTRNKRLKIFSKAIKMRFPLTAENRQEMVDEALETMRDPTSNAFVRLKANQILVAMEAMNQKDEHAQEGIGDARAEPTLVYVLPVNGTERIGVRE